MNRPRSRPFRWVGGLGAWLLLPLLLLACLASVALWKSGKWLVASDSFERMPWAVVLAGQGRDCERTDAACRLFLDGRVDTLVISGCRIFKDRYESEFVIGDMVKQGYPRGKLFEFRQDAYSTAEEARLLIKQFRFQGLDTVLIITSNYHSRRARMIFNRLAGGSPYFKVYPADYPAFDPAAWWAGRQSRKIWLEEWLKVANSWWELRWAKPVEGRAESGNLIPDIWAARSLEVTGAKPAPVPASDTVRAAAPPVPDTARAAAPVAPTPAAAPPDTSGQGARQAAADSLAVARAIDSIDRARDRRRPEGKPEKAAKSAKAKPKAADKPKSAKAKGRKD